MNLGSIDDAEYQAWANRVKGKIAGGDVKRELEKTGKNIGVQSLKVLKIILLLIVVVCVVLGLQRVLAMVVERGLLNLSIIWNMLHLLKKDIDRRREDMCQQLANVL